MAGYPGTANLMEAFAGGGRLEDAAYNTSAARIMQARNQQSMMDKRVLESSLLKDQLRSRGNFERNPGDIDEATKFAILAELAPGLKAGREAEGVGQINDARGNAVRIAAEIEAAGGDPTDVMNAFIGSGSSKLLAPTNVNVQGQADANLGKIASEIFSNTAQGGNYNASAELTRSKIGNTSPMSLESLTKDQAGMLWSDPTNPENLPVTVGTDWFGDGPERDEMLPFDDPRAQKRWAGMEPEEREAMMTRSNYGPEFMQWRVENMGQDPTLGDSDIAIGKFLAMKQGKDLLAKKKELYAPTPPNQSDFADVESGKATPEEFEAHFGVPYSIARRQ